MNMISWNFTNSASNRHKTMIDTINKIAYCWWNICHILINLRNKRIMRRNDQQLPCHSGQKRTFPPNSHGVTMQRDLATINSSKALHMKLSWVISTITAVYNFNASHFKLLIQEDDMIWVYIKREKKSSSTRIYKIGNHYEFAYLLRSKAVKPAQC